MLVTSINGLGVCFILVGHYLLFGWMGLTGVRLFGVGVSDQPSAAVVAVGEVFRSLYCDVGDYSELLRGCEELFGGDCHSLVPWCL